MNFKVTIMVFFALLCFSDVFVCAETADPGYGTLTAYANRYKTDKGTTTGERHGFTEVYEYFFHPIQHTARKILEIGIAEGGSLKMFRDYFPQAMVYGIDIENMASMDSMRLMTFVADQGERSQLEAFIKTAGGDFDLILDDGGHWMHQQQVSFGYLFRYVKPGGYYIIEDVHTSIFRNFSGSYGAQEDERNTTLFMINQFIKTGGMNSLFMTDEEKKYIEDHVAYCTLVNMGGNSISCIFKKK